VSKQASKWYSIYEGFFGKRFYDAETREGFSAAVEAFVGAVTPTELTAAFRDIANATEDKRARQPDAKEIAAAVSRRRRNAQSHAAQSVEPPPPPARYRWVNAFRPPTRDEWAEHHRNQEPNALDYALRKFPEAVRAFNREMPVASIWSAIRQGNHGNLGQHAAKAMGGAK